LKPQAGNIIVDGVNIFDDIKGWRSKIAYIPQEIFIINDTIRNNIILGDDPQSISNTRLDDAISQSKLTQFINDLPDGLSSNGGDKGVSISGGQKQRVAIARALYHQREILILDEATSALDSSTEEKITGQFEALKGKKTVICIAHRTSTLKSCNKIYSIENGIIIQKNSI
jgi:ABC-type multidrug transport system fused ATPase/permease subunit